MTASRKGLPSVVFPSSFTTTRPEAAPTFRKYESICFQSMSFLSAPIVNPNSPSGDWNFCLAASPDGSAAGRTSNRNRGRTARSPEFLQFDVAEFRIQFRADAIMVYSFG